MLQILGQAPSLSTGWKIAGRGNVFLRQSLRYGELLGDTCLFPFPPVSEKNILPVTANAYVNPHLINMYE